MEDLRREKREQNFFSLPNFDTVKRKREQFLVGLRKKKKQEKFNKVRFEKLNEINLIELDQKLGLIDYSSLYQQTMK
jgi:hypothetical protein